MGLPESISGLQWRKAFTFKSRPRVEESGVISTPDVGGPKCKPEGKPKVPFLEFLELGYRAGWIMGLVGGGDGGGQAENILHEAVSQTEMFRVQSYV